MLFKLVWWIGRQIALRFEWSLPGFSCGIFENGEYWSLRFLGIRWEQDWLVGHEQPERSIIAHGHIWRRGYVAVDPEGDWIWDVDAAGTTGWNYNR